MLLSHFLSVERLLSTTLLVQKISVWKIYLKDSLYTKREKEENTNQYYS